MLLCVELCCCGVVVLLCCGLLFVVVLCFSVFVLCWCCVGVVFVCVVVRLGSLVYLVEFCCCSVVVYGRCVGVDAGGVVVFRCVEVICLVLLHDVLCC